MNRKYLILLLFPLFLFNCKSGSNEKQLFEKLPASTTNIDFENKLTEDDSLSILDYLYYYNGGGVAAGDINNDGKTDLYFVSNRGENKLYLNEDAMKFKDITKQAGIAGKSNWKTGVSMADVNGDGWLDIYVSVVGNYKGLNGKNELYINNKNGTFTEKAAEYGLDFKGFATQASFFDYDKDGDLDCYILTHAVHSVSSYDRVSARALRDGEAGDYLMKNENGKFVNVSKEAGIYGAAMGYGLGIVTADLNNDGWEDIYVSNDFHEDDYYYINQKNGTFKESVKEAFKHLSKYSMGCDVADVNNDGYLDVFTADMHPEDETVEKLSLGEDAYDIYYYKLNNFGFYNQYSRNCLQISHKGKFFSDISQIAGIASTDWSWSPIFADFDNDGVKDLFVSNGIPRRPNNMDYIKYLNGSLDSSVSHSIPVYGEKINDKKAIEKMPEGKVPNYIYKGTDGWKFEDKSKVWGFDEETVSNGAIYADLDNDGDLDIITNNQNSPAAIYQNNSEKINPESKYLKVKLEGNTGNNFGIGAKVFIKNANSLQFIQQQPIRGFMSSNDPILHFGIGKISQIDSLIVIWGNGKMEVKTNVKANQTVICKQVDAQQDGSTFIFDRDNQPIIEEIPNLITQKHNENSDYIDFIREPLIPFLASTEGPKLAIGDINGDGLDDIYQCGARNKERYVLIQQANGAFKELAQPAFSLDFEDTDAAFFDADGDKDLDLYVTTGGNEYFENMVEIKDRLYLNDGKGNFTKKEDTLPNGSYPNKSCVKPCDFDKDGDIDLFVGSHTLSSSYGIVPNSYLWVNDGKGKFTDQTPAELKNVGMVTNATWVDLNKDGNQDLIVVGEWMGIRTFMNQNKKLVAEKNGLENKTGFWQGLNANDFDGDGDIDLIVGNLGTNTKYIKQVNPKMRMYANDMDGNGNMEQIIAYEKNGGWYPAASRDDLARMAPGLINSRFPEYSKYAGKEIGELFTKEELNGKNAHQYEVNTFESVFVENLGNGKFEVKPLPKEAQVSKIYAIKTFDVDGDKKNEILLGGNLYGVSTYQGRYDASYGLILKHTKNGFVSMMPTSTGFILNGEVRDIQSIKTAKSTQIIVARNNQTPQVFKIK